VLVGVNENLPIIRGLKEVRGSSSGTSPTPMATTRSTGAITGPPAISDRTIWLTT